MDGRFQTSRVHQLLTRRAFTAAAPGDQSAVAVGSDGQGAGVPAEAAARFNRRAIQGEIRRRSFPSGPRLPCSRTSSLSRLRATRSSPPGRRGDGAPHAAERLHQARRRFHADSESGPVQPRPGGRSGRDAWLRSTVAMLRLLRAGGHRAELALARSARRRPGSSRRDHTTSTTRATPESFSNPMVDNHIFLTTNFVNSIAGRRPTLVEDREGGGGVGDGERTSAHHRDPITDPSITANLTKTIPLRRDADFYLFRAQAEAETGILPGRGRRERRARRRGRAGSAGHVCESVATAQTGNFI